jgi:hypothetical protein
MRRVFVRFTRGEIKKSCTCVYTQPSCQDSPSKVRYTISELQGKLNMFSKVKPKEC